MDSATEDLQNAASAGAEIKQAFEGRVAGCLQIGFLAVGFGNIQRPDRVPTLGIFPEVLGSCGSAFLLNRFQSLKITRQLQIVL
ncbi:MAG: hypothetical protein R3268_12625, partial [Acidiferrobacterales bacterium]|nr:hypothetical protein [Acidiferrobacterales bacterium]